MAVALVMGNMIGSGIFLLPASLAPYGALGLAGWAVSSVGALLLAWVFARLARIEPAAGGPYAYTRRAFGDLAAFLVAWGYWISIWTSLAALAVAFVGYLTPFVPALARIPAAAALVAVTAIWVLVAANAAGVRTAGRVQAVTTALKLLPLVLIALAGIVHFDVAPFAAPRSGTGPLAADVAAVVALTLWAFLGLEAATVPAEHIRDPDRTIPRATLTGTALAALVYIFSTVGVMVLLDQAALGASTAPFADAAAALGGAWAAKAVAAGAAISCFGALNGWMLLVGELPLAVARDGLFPRVFSRLSSRGTPVAGTVLAGALATALVSLNYARGLVELFTFFILLSTLSTLVAYAFSSLSVFLLREGRGRRLPAAGAVAAGLAFAYSLWAMGGAGADVVYWGFLLLMCGLPVYVAVKRSATV